MKVNVAAIKMVGALLGISLLSLSAGATPHNTEKQAGADNGSATPPALPSVLQVTGTTNSFTISAQHADVLSLLKLVFDQAHRQFAPDASVTGDVTFALSGQKFDTVLAAICKQTFLRVEVDSHGIYQFRRDEEALRTLLLKTQAINAVLSDQLRGMGYAVPPTLLGTDNLTRMRGAQGAPGGAVSGGFGGIGGGGVGGRAGGGGFGDRTGGVPVQGRKDAAASNAPATVAKPDASQMSKRGAQSDKNDPTTAAGAAADLKAETNRKLATRSDTETKLSASPRNRFAGESGSAGPAGPAAPNADSIQGGLNRDGQSNGAILSTQDFNLADAGQYQLFMKQNSFVSVNTKNRPAPVQDVLADISKQAGVPILIDPDVPKGDDFVVSATIPARPLNEMLNILGYYARLEWRWVNGRIYVTTTPQLQLYLRGNQLPAPANATNVGGGIRVVPKSSPPAGQSPTKQTEDAGKAKKDKGD